MIRTRIAIVVLLLLHVAGCLPPSAPPAKQVLTDQGEVLLYLQPMPQEAHKFNIVIASIAAIRADGLKIPLSLLFLEMGGVQFAERQRMLAMAVLPPGSYTGVSIQIERALVQTEEGKMALFVPETPIIAEKSFEIERGKATTLFLSFSGSDAITEQVRFSPLFTLATSRRQLTNLLGYVSGYDSNLIFVFNKKTMQVVDAIATGRGPKGIALDQERARAYVAASEDDAVEVYDVFNERRIGVIKLNFGDEPVDVALTPDGRTLVAVNRSSNTVSIIDTLSMFVVERIGVGEGPISVVVDPSGFRAYIVNPLSSTISIIDLTQRTVTVTISVDGSPLQAVFNRAGDKLFVITRDRPDLTVIDPSQLSVANRIYIGPGAASVKVDTLTGLVLVGKTFGGQITVAEPFTSMFVDTIEVGGKASFMTIDNQENTLFVVLRDKGTLQKINLTSKKIMAELDVGERPYEVVVIGER
jgi:YVTN family beta-propeller protein